MRIIYCTYCKFGRYVAIRFITLPVKLSGANHLRIQLNVFRAILN